ncbi:ABC transporter ATP-binding protein [[Clostridium] fimetarium]|uniref:ATP-binding cassette, subfamily B n=1 Tax=[Clostridium] fimetarium TaxID=99656 RepID=A0A1I0QBL2_9FIRM|nr:ABC transporter ATP-binding protein [[Clostridium] fimetarium]SEW24286.1 ATP-binding cassette, subfamily B [[Clostridium] fimetarium]
MARTGAEMFSGGGPKIHKGTSAEEILSNSKSINKKGTIRRLGKYLFRYKFLMILALTMSFASNVFSLLGPRLSGLAIDNIEGGVGKVAFDKVFYYCGLMAAFYIISSILSYVLSVLMVNISQKIIHKMREDVFGSLMRLPISYFDTHQTGEILSKMSYDIDTVNTSLSTDLVQLCTSLITVVGSFVMMASISTNLLFIFVITIPMSIFITKFIVKKTRPLFRERSASLGRMNGFVEEMIAGQKTLKAYNQENNTIIKFKKKNEDAVMGYYNADYFGSMTGPFVNFINNLSLALITVFGAILYMQSAISLGNISSFVLYSRKFSGPINEAANIMGDFQSALAAAERVFRVIDEPKEAADIFEAKTLTDVLGEVDVKNVDFGYVKGRPILKNLSFHAEPGKLVAIVGTTGAGKTTIINLLMRFYDIDSGNITVDGNNILDVTRDSLRKSYAMVLQDTWLFRGTVFDNIAYGKEHATMEEVVEAAKASKIHNYIIGLPQGYDTILSEEGTNISKGQKQLITIARAMLLDSNMLILDEATSNVDIRTESKIQDAMRRLMKEKTCFVIAHRLSTIQNADEILVVKAGNIVEQGTHTALMGKMGTYYNMYVSQWN